MLEAISENRDAIMDNRQVIVSNQQAIAEANDKLDALIDHLEVDYKRTGFNPD